ncbi:alpha/beta hydrolase [Massilia sp. GCM10020059]|uniref:Alpha/beta hydrolase n=1 Tax=Massilia agrisoli TaxID=2892444 RepID=A0ABS8IPR5_9BURK|nr:alpha/beta hydrolase-fold protein [Massilia agrisoli]MCC6070589.1 alpha/beta hydrolase [Massilia agrisoli]
MRSVQFLSSMLVLAAVSACSERAPDARIGSDHAPQPYVLEGTEVRDIRAKSLHRDYQLFISLPRGYAESTRRYPVLFVTDANYAFPLIRSIARRIRNGGEDMEDFILVGLSYAKGETPEYSRRRDYTPTANGDRDAVSDMLSPPPVYGEAEGYRKFIAEEVFPMVAHHYRADMKRAIYAGHSFGGLFGLHVLFTEPSMFEKYIIGSPSLWFDRRVAFATERSYAKSHSDLPAKVFMAVASYETLNFSSNNPRYNKTVDMVRDLQAMEHVLESRRYKSLEVQTLIIPDEDHLTVFPAVITRGLKWALPPERIEDGD